MLNIKIEIVRKLIDHPLDSKMGKKDKDKKKKGKGAEKTLEKTEKKAKLKAKKELAAKGEDDIENIVKSIEEEERKRQEVKEVKIDHG